LYLAARENHVEVACCPSRPVKVNALRPMTSAAADGYLNNGVANGAVLLPGGAVNAYGMAQPAVEVSTRNWSVQRHAEERDSPRTRAGLIKALLVAGAMNAHPETRRSVICWASPTTRVVISPARHRFTAALAGDVTVMKLLLSMARTRTSTPSRTYR
jgi:hypothetical protein